MNIGKGETERKIFESFLRGLEQNTRMEITKQNIDNIKNILNHFRKIEDNIILLSNEKNLEDSINNQNSDSKAKKKFNNSKSSQYNF